MIVGASAGTSTDELTLVPSTTKSGKNAKQVPSLEHGYLVQVCIDCFHFTRRSILFPKSLPCFVKILLSIILISKANIKTLILITGDEVRPSTITNTQ